MSRAEINAADEVVKQAKSAGLGEGDSSLFVEVAPVESTRRSVKDHETAPVDLCDIHFPTVASVDDFAKIRFSINIRLPSFASANGKCFRRQGGRQGHRTKKPKLSKKLKASTVWDSDPLKPRTVAGVPTGRRKEPPRGRGIKHGY